MGNYWDRHLPTKVHHRILRESGHHSHRHCETQHPAGPKSPATLAQAHLCLPIQYRGTGLRSLTDHQHNKYLGGLVQGISSLKDRRTEERISLPGQLCTNRMKEWLDHNSFMNTPAVNPWDTILTHTTTSLIIRTLLYS